MASMAEAHDAHAAHAVDEHATDDVHGHDDHGRHATEAGPIDVQAWGALAVGVLLGLLVVLALVQSLN
jgi:hypothetical protein